MALEIEVCHRNQPNNTKLYCMAINFTLRVVYYQELHISNKMECFSYKDEYGIRVFRDLIKLA